MPLWPTFFPPRISTMTSRLRTLESIRWADGRVCPHCGTVDRSYATQQTPAIGAIVYRCGDQNAARIHRHDQERDGVQPHRRCTSGCRASTSCASSKKGISAHQLHRSLGITYKAAWFMAHRIREAMRAGGLDRCPWAATGMEVEADETYYGPIEREKRRTTRTSGEPFIKPGKRGRRGGPANKRPIVALVERGGRSARSMCRWPTRRT